MLDKPQLGRPLTLRDFLKLQFTLYEPRFVPFLDAFTGANGAALAPNWTAPTWDIQGNAARNSPTAGAELTVNGGFDSDTTWIKGTGWSIAAGVASCDGSQVAASNLYQNNSIVAYTFYLVTFTVSNYAAGSVSMNIGGFISSSPRSSNGTFTQIIKTLTSNGRIYIVANSTFVGDIDNVSIKPLTLSELFATVNRANKSNVTAQVEATTTAATQAGIVICLDNAANPANFIVGYHNRTKAYLEKCVAGTYTSLISSTAAYAAGGIVKVIKSESSVDLWYNGNKIGATQTVSNTGIVSNTIHGIFDTYAGTNRLDNFSLTSP